MTLFGLLVLSHALAAGEATQCVFFVKKVELKTASGDWKTAYEGNLPLDLAAAEPSVSFKNAGAPEGEYVSARLVVDETAEITGSDGGSFTREGGDIEMRGTASDLSALPGEVQSLTEKAPTYSTAAAGPMRVTLDFDYADRDRTFEVLSRRDFDKPFAVRADSKIAVSLKTDLKKAVMHVWPGYYKGFPENDVMILDFPEAFSEFSIQVDGKTCFSTGGIDVQF